MRLFSLYFSLLFTQNLLAAEFEYQGLEHLNTNPFVEIHDLPGYTGVKQLNSGELKTHIELQISNEFHQDKTNLEQLSFDFERTQIQLNLQYGINDTYSVGMKIPYISNSGGFLDGWIEDWHDVFDLPQGGRDNAATDEFGIFYSNQTSQFSVDNTGNGIGDIALFVDRQLFWRNQRSINSRASVKLPTGDEAQLFGSGGYSFSLNLSLAQQFSSSWYGFSSIGMSYLRTGRVLPEQQKNWVGTAVIGTAWQFSSRLSLLARLDYNSAVYEHTRLDGIKGQGGTLYLGAQYVLSNKSTIALGFTEDVINKDAVPDFGLRLSYGF